MYKYEGMSRYILNKVETSHHMIRLFHFDDFNYEDDINHISFLSIATQLAFFHNL
jgi:hypothetical protein